MPLTFGRLSTADEAFERLRKSGILSDDQFRCLEYMREIFPEGAATPQVMRAVGLKEKSGTARMSDLNRLGYIMPSGRRTVATETEAARTIYIYVPNPRNRMDEEYPINTAIIGEDFDDVMTVDVIIKAMQGLVRRPTILKVLSDAYEERKKR